MSRYTYSYLPGERSYVIWDDIVKEFVVWMQSSVDEEGNRLGWSMIEAACEALNRDNNKGGGNG